MEESVKDIRELERDDKVRAVKLPDYSHLPDCVPDTRGLLILQSVTIERDEGHYVVGAWARGWWRYYLHQYGDRKWLTKSHADGRKKLVFSNLKLEDCRR